MQLFGQMVSRDPDQAHRGVTPLELFFDLSFSVAIAECSAALEQGLARGEFRTVLVAYPLVFFGIWWAWMNFTWFASAFDIDDVAYRIAVLVQVAGVLILAAGASQGVLEADFHILVLGYIVMRLSMVSLWLRAAAADRRVRQCALRYAGGITVVQVGWVAWLTLPREAALPLFLLLASAELAVPLWAEAAGRTAWHPAHIAERYGLFTIIVLGETLLAATIGLHAALERQATFGEVATIVVGGLLTVFSMWWLYFDLPGGLITAQVREVFSDRLSGAFTWGYGHYVVFASAAAVGAGFTVAVDHATHETRIDDLGAALAVTLPVTIYLLMVWALHAPYKRPSRLRGFLVPGAALAILASSLTHEAVLYTGIFLVGLVAFSVVTGDSAAAEKAG